MLLAASLLAACGSDDGPAVILPSDAPFVPVIESSDLAVGETRIVLTLLDRDRAPTFPPETAFRVRLFEPINGEIRFRTDAVAQVIPVGDRVYYSVAAPLDGPGQWALEVTALFADGASRTSARLPFLVPVEQRTLAVGSAAIPSPTLTLADGPPAEISSDPNPNAALYEVSVAQALETRRPFVLALTSVGFCFGRGTCQRAVDQLKRLAPAAGLLAIHAEPLTNLGDGAAPLPSPSNVLADWRLENDPWIFVVNADGMISARFEVAVSDAELSAAFQAAVETKR